jgi:hypothetical protein
MAMLCFIQQFNFVTVSVVRLFSPVGLILVYYKKAFRERMMKLAPALAVRSITSRVGNIVVTMPDTD